MQEVEKKCIGNKWVKRLNYSFPKLLRRLAFEYFGLIVIDLLMVFVFAFYSIEILYMRMLFLKCVSVNGSVIFTLSYSLVS